MAQNLDDILRNAESLEAALANSTAAIDKEQQAREESREKLGRAFAQAAKDVTGATKSFVTAMHDTSKGMSKYSASVNQAGDAITSITKPLGLFGAGISLLVKVLGASVETVLKYNDRLNNAFDTLAEIGGATSLTADGMKDLAHRADFTTENLDKFAGLLVDMGPEVLLLGRSFKDGAKKFADLVDQTDEQRMQMGRLGIDQERYATLTAKFLKIQQASGLSQQQQTKITSQTVRDYIINLTELSRLTGKSRDELLQQELARNNDVKYQALQTDLIERGQTKQLKVIKDVIAGLSDSPEAVEAFIDTLVNGAVTSEKNAKTNAMFGFSLESVAQSILNGNANYDQLTKQIANGQLQTYQQFRSVIAAGGAEALGYQAHFLTTAQNLNKIIDSKGQTAVDKMGSMGDSAKDTSSQLKNMEISVRKATDNLAESIQGPVNSALQSFTAAVREATEMLENLIDKVGGYLGIKTKFTLGKEQLDQLESQRTDLKRQMREASNAGNQPLVRELEQKLSKTIQTINQGRGSGFTRREFIEKFGYEPDKSSPDAGKMINGGLGRVYDYLKNKDENIAGGPAQRETVDLAHVVLDMFKNQGIQFTAFNDRHHKGKGAHGRGEAFDFTLAGMGVMNDKNPELVAKRKAVVEQIKSAYPSATVLDEYTNPIEGKTTAGHFHVQLKKMAMGGILSSPTFALAGEAGPEAYVPLPDGKTIPVTIKSDASGLGSMNDSMVSMLSNKMDMMIDYLRSTAVSQQDLVLIARNS